MEIESKRLKNWIEKRQKKLHDKILKEKVLTKQEIKQLSPEDKILYRKIKKKVWGRENYRKQRKKQIEDGLIKKKREKYFITYICDECGKEFKRKNWRNYRKTQYCSNECKYIGVNRNNREKYRKILLTKSRYGEKEIKYRIVVVLDGKQRKGIKRYMNKETALNDYDKFLKENKEEVILPVKYTARKNKIKKYEILLLKKNEDDINNRFPNEYGKLIENIVEVKHNTRKKTNNWVILNKKDYYYEETFMVYGYGQYIKAMPQKNIKFILDNLIFNNDKNKQLSVYKNKLIIRYGELYDINLIIAKNKNIIIDLYNKIKEICDKMAMKHISFMGFGDGSLSRRTSEDLIQRKTGWDLKKIRKCMSSN